MNPVDELLVLISQNGRTNYAVNKIAKQLKRFVKNESFYKLPFNYISKIINKADFESNEESVETFSIMITKMNQIKPDEAILLLNIIPNNCLTEEQILKILFNFKHSPLISGLAKFYEDKNQLPEKDYEYEINEIVDKINPFMAAEEGRLEVLKTKIEGGFDKESKNQPKGQTILHYAAMGNQIEVMKYLLEEIHCKVDPRDKEGKTPLAKAAKKGKYEAVVFLYRHGADLNSGSNMNWYPIHTAAKWGHVDILQFLIDNGVNVDLREGNDRRTPLYLACERGRYDAAKLLIENHAAIDSQTKKSKYTPLHAAAHKGFTDIVDLLIASGANVLATTRFNQTPLDSANQNGKKECSDIIKKAGGKANKYFKPVQ